MKTIGKILSLLALLSISFSIFASIVRCPDIGFLNSSPKFKQSGQAVISEEPGSIGLVRIEYLITPPGTDYDSWTSASILGGQIYCAYKSTVGTTIYFATDTNIGGWKRGTNGPPWIGDRCTGNILSCYMTNS